MNIEDTKLEIDAITARISLDKEKLKASSQELANMLCPFKTGDRVTNEEGENLIVAYVSGSSWGDRYTMGVFKIKKDGHPFSCSNRLYGDVKKLTLTE